MKTIWILGLTLAVLIIAAIVYRACAPRPVLQVEPHAGREIEKARQR
jgi:hypothetical protein